MKKFLLSVLVIAASLTVNAEEWFFVYDGNSWATDESTMLKPTETSDVYELKNYELTADAVKGGLNYQITNKGWGIMYGWCAEADGNDVVGSTYKLGRVGNAWINCESGVYDITFNAAEETIRFDVADNTGVSAVEVEGEQSEAVYYTVTGVRVDRSNLNSGLYIVKTGKKVSKILVK